MHTVSLKAHTARGGPGSNATGSSSTLQSHECNSMFLLPNHLVGLVGKASASRAVDLGFDSHLCQDFSRSSHTSDLKIGSPVATLPGTWHYTVSDETGWSGVSIL